jgi:hypothetical protein
MSEENVVSSGFLEAHDLVLRDMLFEGEEPLVTFARGGCLVLTNQRLILTSKVRHFLDGKLEIDSPLHQVSQVVIKQLKEDAGRTYEMTFHLEIGRRVKLKVSQEVAFRVRDLFETKVQEDLLSEKQTQRIERKAESAALDQKRKQDELEQYGKVIASEVYAGRTIKIYEKGYVRIGILGNGAFERLLGISGSSNAVTKTALGRGLAAVATAGISFAATPRHRGKVQLTIVTDVTTHQLTSTPPTDSDMNAMFALETVGKAVLEANRPGPPQTSSPAGQDLSDQLAKLASLRDSGALSEPEFAAAKKQLLGL